MYTQTIPMIPGAFREGMVLYDSRVPLLGSRMSAEVSLDSPERCWFDWIVRWHLDRGAYIPWYMGRAYYLGVTDQLLIAVLPLNWVIGGPLVLWRRFRAGP